MDRCHQIHPLPPPPLLPNRRRRREDTCRIFFCPVRAPPDHSSIQLTRCSSSWTTICILPLLSTPNLFLGSLYQRLSGRGRTTPPSPVVLFFSREVHPPNMNNFRSFNGPTGTGRIRRPTGHTNAPPSLPPCMTFRDFPDARLNWVKVEKKRRLCYTTHTLLRSLSELENMIVYPH